MVPRLIRNKSLPINLIEMTEKNKLKFSYGCRICIVEESRRIITNRCRNESEYSTKTTYADAYRTQGREHTKSEGETGRTRDSYHGRMTYGTRNTVRNR
jgi:hypothetical protein